MLQWDYNDNDIKFADLLIFAAQKFVIPDKSVSISHAMREYQNGQISFIKIAESGGTNEQTKEIEFM